MKRFDAAIAKGDIVSRVEGAPVNTPLNRSNANATIKCAQRALGMDQRGLESVHQTVVCLGVDDSGDVSGLVCDVPCDLPAAFWPHDVHVDDIFFPTGWRNSNSAGVASWADPTLPADFPGYHLRNVLAVRRALSYSLQATTRRADRGRRSLLR